MVTGRIDGFEGALGGAGASTGWWLERYVAPLLAAASE